MNDVSTLLMMYVLFVVLYRALDAMRSLSKISVKVIYFGVVRMAILKKRSGYVRRLTMPR